MREIKIFVSASDELKEDREQIVAFINAQSNENLSKEIFLKLISWEEITQVPQTRAAELYNNALNEADVFVMLLSYKLSKYAREEFAVALNRFKATNRPYLLPYIRDSVDRGSIGGEMMSIVEFKNKLESIGHYYTVYASSKDLPSVFNTALQKLINRWQDRINDEKQNMTGKLDLSNCFLDSVPQDLVDMKWLKELKLSYNQIEKIENLHTLQDLEIIELNYNKINEITQINKLQNLKTIDLSNNRIRSIAPLLRHIRNGLNVFPRYLKDVSKSNAIFVVNNPLVEPSEETIFSGRDSILKYFDDSSKYGQEKLEILKLILVGNSRVGKTNFSEFLRTRKITANNDSTHLLEIQKWDASFLKSGNGTLTRVHIFDFGGQDYYHDSHRMFYSHDTAYILLWDTLSNKYSEELSTKDSNNPIVYENFPLSYWLESINYILKDEYVSTYEDIETGRESNKNLPPILIIQNKIDIEEGKLNQIALSSKYPNIWGYYCVSLEKKKRTKILDEILSDYLHALNLSARNLVRYQMKVINFFLDDRRTLEVFSMSDFLQKCKDIIDDPTIVFNEADAHIIAHILNNTGLALYDRRTNNESLVFSNIKTLNEIVKQIMDIAQKGDQGIFHVRDIKAVRHHENILKLLCKNNSIISINDEEYLTPQFLHTKPDKSIAFFLDAFKYNQVRFVYRAYFHKYILLSLFSKYLKGKHIDTSIGVKGFPFWRNGIIISKGDGSKKEMVYVEFTKDSEKGTINLKTMLPFNNLGLEKEIESTLDELNKGWTVEKEISVDSSVYFNLEDVKIQAKAKQYEFVKEGKKFGINDFKNLAEFQNLPKRLFISYSSKNSDFTKRFLVHLEVLKSNGLIDPWYDRMIEPGTRWDETIRKELQNSDIVIFLLSPDFIATKYIFDVEIPLAIEQRQGQKANFFFIELQSCSWERTVLKDYQQTGDSGQEDKNVITISQSTNDTKWMEAINALEKKIKAN